MSMTRGEFVRAAALTGAAAAALGGGAVRSREGGGDPTGPGTVRALEPLPDAAGGTEDVLLTLQRDLARAMAKPAEQRRWGMLIDLRKCVGCHACTIGCVAENKLPPGVVYRPVTTEETGVFPDVRLQFRPRPCMQCQNPSCVPVCPVRATWKRPDGVTVVDYDRCIGCRHCLTACPYGARTSDFGHHYKGAAAAGAPGGGGGPVLAATPNEERPNHEYAKAWTRQGHVSPVGNARKCHFCLHRLEVGQLPVCVTTCIGRATLFGDMNDAAALMTRRVRQEPVHTLLPHRGTQPMVFYIS